MSGLAWAESLSAPRSLATRREVAVAVVEDPGVLELCLPAGDDEAVRRCSWVLGADLPTNVWQVAHTDDMHLVWVGPSRWRVLLPRDRVASHLASLVETAGAARVADLTGAFSCFRIAGTTAGEILARVCPLDLSSVDPFYARGTSIAGVRCFLVRESGSVTSWMVLVPRSYAEHVGAAFVEAARTPGSLGLFEPAPPPPV
jgi:heterotetrameric sarcosine oxidase gamma subunit